jgi:ubiquinone/menaquinone biosynthesis C-methylase UbiE
MYVFKKKEQKRLENQARFDKFTDMELELIPKSSPKKILDVGCGTGAFTRKLREKFKSSIVFGIDIRDEAINTANKLSKNINYLKSNIENTNFKDNTFDLITVKLVFQHIKYPRKAIKEIKRLLKPDGILMIIDIDEDSHLYEPKLPLCVQKLFHAKREYQEYKSGDRGIGKKLFKLLTDAKYKNVNVEILPSIWAGKVIKTKK